MRVPADFEVRPIRRGSRAMLTAVDLCMCGNCLRMWDDAVVTGLTPAPSARCPFERFHS